MHEQLIEALSKTIDVHVQLRKALLVGPSPGLDLFNLTINRGRLVEVLCYELKNRTWGA
jgi:hypothetical protein